MKKTLFTLAVLFSAVPFIYGQTPQYHTGVANGNVTTFLSGSPFRRQFIYPHDSFPSLVPGNIHTIYMKRNTATAVTVNDISIKLGLTGADVFNPSLPALVGNMNTVYTSPALTINTGLTGEWISIPLQTPFYYDGQQNLVLEIVYGSASGNFQMKRTSRSNGGIQTSDTTNNTSLGVLAITLDLGLDITPVASVPVLNLNLAQNVDSISADLSATLVSDGGSAIQRKGFVWSLNNLPQLSDPNSDSMDVVLWNSLDFDTLLTTLPPGSKIYYRAFAVNNSGTGYSLMDSVYTISLSPAQHVQNLSYIPACNAIILEWDSIPGVSGYLVLQTPSQVFTQTPANRTAYNPGNVLGNGIVSAVIQGATNNQLTVPGLTPGSTIRFQVIAFNYNGTDYQTYHYYTVPQIPLLTTVVDPLPAPVVATATDICENDTLVISATAVYGTIEWYDHTGSNLVFTGDTFTTSGITSDTTFYVLAFHGNCNSNSVLVTVNYHVNPVVITGNDTSICAGQQVLIGGSTIPGYIYLWTSQSGTFTSSQSQQQIQPSTGDTYYLVVTDIVSGCSSSDTVSVGVHPLPAVPVITKIDTVLYSSVPSGNQWYHEGNMLTGETGQVLVISPADSGYYYVIITDMNGCSAVSDSMYIVPLLSTENPGNQEEWTIFPNPADDILNIRSQPGKYIGTIVITDVTGQTVHSMTFLSENGIVFLQGIPAGTYILQYQEGARTFHKTFIKK